jgi:dTDP-4-dehydrorhamnose reductase
MKKTIIVGTGLDGMIGSRVQELLKEDFDFIHIPQKEMDISNIDTVENKLKSLEFDLFVHFAAFTNVDLCETEKDLAWKVNVEGTKNVFETVKKMGKRMIHISTDFVFDGQNAPYFEDSTPNPISYYGKTKYEAEKIVKDKAMIVRLSFPYRANFKLKKDIVRNIIDLLNQHKSIKGVTDSMITLTFIDDIAYALKYLFNHYSYNIYNIVGVDSLTPYDMIIKICDVFNLDKSLVSKITYEEFYKGKAQRPKNSVIKTKNNDFYKMKTFDEGLAEMKKQIEYGE